MQRIARTVFNAPRLSARAQASQRAFSSEVKPGEAKKDNKESSTLSKVRRDFRGVQSIFLSIVYPTSILRP